MKRDSFEISAKSYNSNSIIQKCVAKELVSHIDFDVEKILELGAGTGEVIKNINSHFSKYIAIDLSPTMLSQHPKAKNIELICGDFEKLDYLLLEHDLLISSSSLQWAQNMEKILKEIDLRSKKFLISIFTSYTFSSLHRFLGVKSPIRSKEEIEKILKDNSIDCQLYTKRYSLKFDNTKEMFRYLKKSGVNREKVLDFKDAKRAILCLESNDLEFEVIFLIKK